jgi:RNA 2',3'-cyclic 3'-phosphodiesterase
MRLFVAVELPDAVRDAARDTAVALGERLKRSRVRLDARWVDVANMHLTVRFIGHVADDRASLLIGGLRPPVRSDPFEVRLAGCGAFPPRGAPRVFWIGVEGGLEGLRGLHEEFNRRVAPFGYAPEERPFSAHLTLARVKDVARGDGPRARAVVEGFDIDLGGFQAGAVTLFQSRLSPHGARYEALARIPLVGPHK